MHGDRRRLEGEWRVERTGGLLPPMLGVWKRVGAGSGETRVGPLVAWPFRVEERGPHVALVYRWPFSFFVDEVSAQADGSWSGRSVLAGLEVGRFRLVRRGPGTHRR